MRKTFDYFFEKVDTEEPLWIQTDNYSVQSTNVFKRRMKRNNVKVVYTPAGCTDVLAVIDDELGRFIKFHVTKCFEKDFESTQKRTDDYTDGNVSASERRILLTKWVGEAWRMLCHKPDLIMGSFKRMGAYNDKYGRENHLVKVRKMMTYTVPHRDDPKFEKLTPQQIEDAEIAEQRARDEMTKEAHTSKQKKLILARKLRRSTYIRLLCEEEYIRAPF